MIVIFVVFRFNYFKIIDTVKLRIIEGTNQYVYKTCDFKFNISFIGNYWFCDQGAY